jgi:hypothetical protein
MWGTGLALVARHAASQPLLVALIATPLCAFLSPSGAAAPLQSACALALTLLEMARLCESAEELVLSAVAVALLLLAPHPTPPLTLVLPLVKIRRSRQHRSESIDTDLGLNGKPGCSRTLG